MFVERREFTVLDVIDATGKFAQPYLLATKTEQILSTAFEEAKAPDTNTIVTPFAATSG